MRIGIVSDTHSKRLPPQMIDDFKRVDFIIHAGDFTESSDYEGLAKIAKVEGVCGNMDSVEICAQWPAKRIIVCGDYRIGLMHGSGPPRTLLDKVRAAFKNEKVDAVIFGHSHHPFNQMMGGVLYFNPGSPTDEIFAPMRSYGILETTPGGIRGHIVKVNNER